MLTVWFVGMAAAALVVTPTVVVAFGDPGRLAGADGDLPGWNVKVNGFRRPRA